MLGQIVTLVGAEEMVTLKVLLATCWGLPASLTWAVKVKVPALAGVPLIAPLAALSAKPPGRDPLAIAQVYGVVPPVAESVAEYATLTVPVGMEVVLITSGEAWTVSVLAAVMPLGRGGNNRGAGRGDANLRQGAHHRYVHHRRRADVAKGVTGESGQGIIAHRHVVPRKPVPRSGTSPSSVAPL